jgi:hypothetical protein
LRILAELRFLLPNAGERSSEEILQFSNPRLASHQRGFEFSNPRVASHQRGFEFGNPNVAWVGFWHAARRSSFAPHGET